jgi:glyoxylase-like metal-dependent hydrolase (beta-lactamase superfamily II)
MVFRPIFNAKDINGDGSQFDRPLKDGQPFNISEIDVEVLHTPYTNAIANHLCGG